MLQFTCYNLYIILTDSGRSAGSETCCAFPEHHPQTLHSTKRSVQCILQVFLVIHDPIIPPPKKHTHTTTFLFCAPPPPPPPPPHQFLCVLNVNQCFIQKCSVHMNPTYTDRCICVTPDLSAATNHYMLMQNEKVQLLL